ncbi:MAG: hypothetical protein L7W40_09890, partial [Akkermansiaceae bacterium]|nr:hypothetical protein [Akkermansiaceae bacterium]
TVMNIDLSKLNKKERFDLFCKVKDAMEEDNRIFDETLDKVIAIVEETGEDLEYFIDCLKAHASEKKTKGKRSSSPSPTLVNLDDTSQTCKIKGKQPEWRKAMKAKSDYNVWDHVKDSLKHLDEEERKINNAWLDKNKPVSNKAI